MSLDPQNIRSTGAFDAGSAPEPRDAADVSPARMAAPQMVPLEPRMLMDAALEWDLTGDNHQIVSLMSDIHQMLTDQMGDYNDFVDKLGDMAGAAVDAMGVLGGPASGSPDNQDAVTAMVERLKEAIATVAAASGAAIDKAFADDAASGYDFDVDLAGKLNTALGLSGGAGLTSAEVDSVFTAERVKANTLDAAIDDLVTTLMTRVDPALDTAMVRDAVDTSLNDILAARLDVDASAAVKPVFALQLENIVEAGDTLVAYTEDLVSGGVDVSIKLQGMSVDLSALSALLTRHLDGASVEAADLVFAGAAPEATFELSTSLTDDKAGLGLTDLEIDALMEFGGDVDLVGAPASMNLGLITADVVGAALSDFKIEALFEDGLDLGGEVDLASGAYASAFDPETAITELEFKVKELGSDEFVSILEDESYVIGAINMAGQLDLLDGVADSGAVTPDAFGARLMVSGVLDSSSASTPAARVTAFLDSVKSGLDVDLSDSIEDADKRAKIEAAVEGLAAMDSGLVLQFLQDSGALMAGLLRSSLFSLDLPFSATDIGQVYADIATVFDELASAFLIDPTAFGYTAGEPSTANVTGTISSQETPLAFDPASLAGYERLHFVIVTGEGEDDVEEIEIDLDHPDWISTTASDMQKAQALAAMITAGLSSVGITASSTNGKLKLTATNTANMPGVVLAGAWRENDDYETTVGLDTLGFTEGQTLAGEGIVVENETDLVLKFLPETTTTLTLPAAFVDAVDGVETIIFSATVIGATGEVSYDIPVHQPAGGWGSNGVANTAGLVASLNAGFADTGVPLTAVMDNGAIKISATPAAGSDSIQFGVLQEKLVRAQDMNQLLDWVNDRLSQTESLADVELTLSEDGALKLAFGDITKTKDVVSGDATGLVTLTDVSVGDLTELSLSGRMAAALSATFGSAAGIDLVAYGESLVDGAGGEKTLLEISHDLDSEDSVAGALFSGSLLKSSFVEDLTMTASVVGEASGLRGTAALGLMDLTIGGSDAAANTMDLTAEYSATVAETLADGSVTTRVSAMRAVEAASAEEAVEGSALRGFESLLGENSLTGTINLELGSIAIVTDADGFIESDMIEGINLSFNDLSDVSADAAMEITGANAESVAALSKLNAGDIKDSFQAVLDLVTLLGDTLEERLGFMTDAIPLLNFSLAEKMNLVSDLADMVAELRDNEELRLGDLQSALQDVFGEDAVEITWNSDDQKLEFEVTLELLTEEDEGLPFKIDLSAILGGREALEDYLDGLSNLQNTVDVTELARALSSIVDKAGDAGMTFDPELGMVFKFDIDLSGATSEGELATEDTLLSDLTTAVAVIDSTAAPAGADLRIDWRDLTANTSGAVGINLGNVTTVGDAVARIDAAVKQAFGSTLSASFDADTGVITITDGNSALIDSADALRLFGAADAASEDDGAGVQAIDFADGVDFAAAASFQIAFGPADGDKGESLTLELAADPTRDSAEEFAVAINAALSTVAVSRANFAADSAAGAVVPASTLVRAEVDGTGAIRLVTTGFAAAAQIDPIAFAVRGMDVSNNVEIKISDLGSSNFARLLGFTTVDEYVSGGLSTVALTAAGVDGAGKSVNLDTAESGITYSFTAGESEGLNLSLGLGVREFNAADGVAQVTGSGDDSEGASAIFAFLDVDGTEDDSYDLGDLFNLVNDSERDAAESFTAEFDIAVDIDLAFENETGHLDPEEHGLTYQSDLLVTDGAQTLADLASDDPSDFISGDMITGVEIEPGPRDANGIEEPAPFDLRLPVADLVDLLDETSILQFLNDPLVLLDGLDMIFEKLQDLIDDFVDDISLPLIGDQLKSSTTFFDDLRFGVLADLRVRAETPDADGNMPTTVDLITGVLNDLISDLFGLSRDTDVFQLHLHEGTKDLPDPYLYGTLNFGHKIWEGDFDVDMNLGGFGFELDIEEGSKVRLALDYFVNIGFGLDAGGFFLLNMQSEPEVSIGLTADAGTFEGSAKLFGLLGVKVDALDFDGDVEDDPDTAADERYSGRGAGEGTAFVTGRIGIDLFSDQGEDILDPEIPLPGSPESFLPGRRWDFSGVTPVSGDGRELGWDSFIYLNELDTSFEKLVEFSFAASVTIYLGLEGNILDPTDSDHNPILIGGKQIIPSIFTELRFSAFYTYHPMREEDERHAFEVTELAFDNVRINAKDLYETVLKPVLDPIMKFIDPLVDAFGWLNDAPFDFLVDGLRKFFPILGIISDVTTVIENIRDFQRQMENGGDGTFSFGSFDYSTALALYYATDGGETEPELNKMAVTPSGPRGPGGFGFFGNMNGFAVEVPLLSDYNNALNLLLGDYENVDLIKLHMNLFNLELPRRDYVQLMLAEIGAPGWVNKIIRSAFKFEMGAEFKAGLSVGYDLSGIVNFINTMDAERLLDGVFIDSTAGSLIKAGFDIFIELNLGIAGVRAGGGASVELGFNDPNDDGKLRIPELLAVLETAADSLADGEFMEALGYIFEGEFNINFNLEVWAGITFKIFGKKVGLEWSEKIVDFDETIPFGGTPLPTGPAPKVADGETAILAVGSNAGAGMTSITKDGDDIITLDGPNSPIQVSLSTGQGNISGQLNQNVGGIIIPAGEGNNTVNLGQLNDNPSISAKPVIVYTGGGTDTIVLPPRGLTVVFSGEGTDTITAPAGATGTYVIFGEKGTDNVNIPGGNVIFIGDSDFGMRDLLVARYAQGNLSESDLCSVLGINPDGTVNASAAANYTTAGGEKFNLHNLLTNYTRLTQATATSSAENLTLGGGNHVILTGGGADTITVTGSNGAVKVYSGAGNDNLSLGGNSLYVEAGAGSDRIFTSANSSEVWGWGQQAGENGLLSDGTAAGRMIDSAALRDGADLMIGGTGADKFFGQLGDDIIEGGLGADILSGGAGIDLIAGGKFTITTTAGQTIDLNAHDPSRSFGRAVNLMAQDLADGGDSLSGGDGTDVLLGGGGGDTVEGNRGADVVVGDFATMRLSTNLVLETLETNFDTSANAGTDVLGGGQGNDILIAGGSEAGAVETIRDLEGSNVVVGDFGKLSGARLSDAVTKAESFRSDRGGSDNIILGDGNDLVLGGEGSDTVSTGNGGDIVVADHGTVDITARKVFSDSLASASAAGDDVVVTGNGAGTDIGDIVVLGRGDDKLTAQGTGGQVVLGDDGVINLNVGPLSAMRSFIPPGDVNTIARIENVANNVESWSDAGSGNDIISATRAALTAITGGGDDDVTIGTGESYVLTDDGKIERGADAARVTVTAATDATAGDDTVAAGSGASLIVTGLGDDSLAAGSGDHTIMTDEGVMVLAKVAGDRQVTLTGANSSGGDDVLVAGNGDLTLMLGLGDDEATLGNGDNVVMGDHGTIERNAASIEMQDTLSSGGDDTLTSGDGDLAVVMGLGNDKATMGEGDIVILGDQGKLEHTAALTKIEDTSANGGNDVITAENGDITAILGLGNDSATLGDGDNVVAADKALVTRTAAKIEMQDTACTGGDDTLTSGDGDLAVVMGLGNDKATMGEGDIVILGDQGKLEHTAALTKIEDTSANGGNDVITAENGDITAILGLGNDSATLGNGDNVVAADKALVTRTATQIQLEDTASAGGNDTVTSGDGDNQIILGLGNDVGTTGNGDSAIFGDKGEITRSATQTLMTDTVTAGGDDRITTGTGNDLVMGGAGNDSVAASNGDNVVFGDTGTIDIRVGAVDTLTSPTNVGDGQDSVTTGTGSDRVILGGGADRAALGAGADYLVADSGVITDAEGTAITLTTTSPAIGGSDTVDGEADNDMIIGGAAGDSLKASAGDDIVLGDQGTIARDAAGRLSAASIDKDNGGADTISGDAGRDVIIAGLAADSVTGGTGDDAILGDLGSFLSATGTTGAALGNLTGLLAVTPADDTIHGNEDADMIIAGLGNDSVNVGTGEDFAMGDSGTITFSDTADIATIEMTEQTIGGNDTIVVDADTGDDILIGQMGNDFIQATGGDDVIIADTAVGFSPVNQSDLYTSLGSTSNVIRLQTIGTAFDNQSNADRMLFFAATKDFAGNDTVSAGAGLDFVMGGYGADSIRGGDNQDMIVGDSAIILRLFTPKTGTEVFEERVLLTNFAFDEGGVDSIDGEGDADILVGGLGADLFYGNTADDLIYSDAFAGLFETTHANGFNSAPMSSLELIKSNFAGQGAVDVVSDSQQAASIGSSLNLLTNTTEEFLPDLLALASSRGLIAAEDILNLVLDQPQILEAIARMIILGADAGLIAEAVIGELVESGILSGNVNALELELLLQAVSVKMGAEAAVNGGSDLDIAAE